MVQSVFQNQQLSYSQLMKRIQAHTDYHQHQHPHHNQSLPQHLTPGSSKYQLRHTCDPSSQFNIMSRMRKNSGTEYTPASYHPQTDLRSPNFDSRKKISSSYQIPNEEFQGNKYHSDGHARSAKLVDEGLPWTKTKSKQALLDYKMDYLTKTPNTIQRSKSRGSPFDMLDKYEKKDDKIHEETNKFASNFLQVPKTNQDVMRTTIGDRPLSPISAKYFSKRAEEEKAKNGSFNSSMLATLDSTPKNTPSPRNTKLQLSDFTLGKRLGEGKFGQVFRVLQKKSKSLFALKRVKKQVIKSHLMEDQFLMEIKMQLFFNHPNILRLNGVFDDPQHIYLLLEYMEEGTLYARLKKSGSLPEEEASQLMADVLKAVAYLHENGVAHRDIKPQNIVLSNGVCKLCDFGWSAVCNDDRRSTMCGTLDYSAPEILEGKEYGRSIDLWCLGVLAFELLVGKAPFYHISRKETMKRIMNAQHEQFVLPSTLSQKARSFIGSLILWEPEERMGAKQALNHPFIRDYAPVEF